MQSNKRSCAGGVLICRGVPPWALAWAQSGFVSVGSQLSCHYPCTEFVVIGCSRILNNQNAISFLSARAAT
jgi:hypothetical protein